MSEVAPESAPRKLPLRRILLGAFALPWANRVAVIRAIGLPMLALVLVDLSWHAVSFGVSKTGAWLAWGAFSVALAWLAITTHRLVLAQGWEARGSFVEFSFRRFAWFIAALLFLWLAYKVIVLIVVSVATVLLIPPRYVPAGESPPPERMPEYFTWMQNAAIVVPYFFIGRLSLMLPAIAVDQRPNLIEAWRSSRGNTWRLAIIVCAMPWALDQMTIFLWRDGVTTLEVALLSTLTGIFAIIGFVALSLSYYELTHESAPPPTHPPG